MKHLWLVWSNLKRRKLRTVFTLGSIVVAFLLFGLLSATRTAFTAGVDLAGVDRLVTQHKVSLVMSLPVSYGNRIAAVAGVEHVTHASWMGGVYQEPRNVIVALPVAAESYLQVYPELLIPEDQRRAWLGNRRGAAVGRVLAERFGWKVGDVVPIRSTIYRKADDSDTWELQIDAIYDSSDKAADLTALFMHYEYFNESLGYAKDSAGWYIFRVSDPQRAPEIAQTVDRLFENSPAETKTSTEKAFAQSFAQQIGNIAAIVTGVLGAVFFSMLLVTGTTMAQAVRERTRELAVLKTLGFTNGGVTALVLAESLALTLAGGLLGLLLAWLLVAGLGDMARRFVGVFYLPPRDIVLGVALVLLFGLLAGALPAAQVLRLRIVDALRRA